MMAPAFEDVEESVQELQPLREAVADCIDQLNDQDRFIVDAVNSEMVSLEELGRRLGFLSPMPGGYGMQHMRGWQCIFVVTHI